MKFIKFINLIIKNVLYYILIYLIRIISPIIKIRFQELETKNIGHYSKSIEIYLSEVELGFYKKNKFDIWIKSKNTANSFLLKKWRKHLLILPNIFFLGFLKFIKNKNLDSLIIPYRHPDKYLKRDWEFCTKENFKDLDMWNFYDNNFVLKKTKPRINISKDEIFYCKKKLKQIFQNLYSEKIILFYARDKFYRENQHRTQKEDMNWRNSKINTYYDSMEAMTNLSFLSIRMGKHLIDKISNNKNKKIFDYPFSNISSDILDIYLCSVCQFGIFDSGGFNSVPSLFRKPLGLVNITHRREIKNRNDSTTPLIIFKKIFSKKLNRQISFSEYEDFNVYKFQKDKDFLENNLEIIDNSSQEIKDLTIEAEARFSSNNFVPDDESVYLQRKAKKILNELYYGNLEYINIGSKFLKQNKELIN